MRYEPKLRRSACDLPSGLQAVEVEQKQEVKMVLTLQIVTTSGRSSAKSRLGNWSWSLSHTERSILREAVNLIPDSLSETGTMNCFQFRFTFKKTATTTLTKYLRVGYSDLEHIPDRLSIQQNIVSGLYMWNPVRTCGVRLSKVASPMLNGRSERDCHLLAPCHLLHLRSHDGSCKVALGNLWGVMLPI